MTPIRSNLAIMVDGPSRRRGKMKEEINESLVKIDLNECKLSEILVHDRSKWRNRIHVVQDIWNEALMTTTTI